MMVSVGAEKGSYFAVVMILLCTIIVICNACNMIEVGFIIGVLASAYLAYLVFYSILFTNLRIALLGFTLMATCLSIWTSSWPAKLRLYHAKPQFLSLIDAAPGNGFPKTPIWIGTYRISKIEVKPAAICFWTDVNSSGHAGLVFCDEPRGNVNVGYCRSLGDGWHIISED